MTETLDIKNAVQTAIQMEKDGYAFYQKAAAQTSSEMGKTVFESLAKDELVHLDVFQKLFHDAVGASEWNALVESGKKHKQIPIFPKDLEATEGIHPETNELDALRIAMDSEQDAIDYYKEMWATTRNKDVKRIIDMIIEQEKQHYFLLQQEFDHLSSTGYWYEFDYLGQQRG